MVQVPVPVPLPDRELEPGPVQQPSVAQLGTAAGLSALYCAAWLALRVYAVRYSAATQSL